MNKRSAITVALGLVAALVIGGVGLTMGMTGPAPSLASVRDPAPKVRTIHRTVTVHRPAASAATVIATAPAPSVGAGAQGGYDDDGFEDEGYAEGHDEGEDHGGSGYEDDEHEAEDD